MSPEVPRQEAAQKTEISTREKLPGDSRRLARPDDAPVWLQRSSLVLLVVTCIYVGLLLVVLPWSHYWQDNHFFSILPERWVDWLQLGSVRGVVSGLGLLDVWIGVSEAIHWRSRR